MRCNLKYALSQTFFLAILFNIYSCKKLVEVDPPVDQISSESVFSNDELATSAVLGMYSQIMQFNNYIGNGAISLYAGLSSDEIAQTFTNASYDLFSNNSLLPGTFVLYANLWQKGYQHIYQANVILEKLDGSSGITTAVKKSLRGEALFMRAFFHFYLTNLFGAIPLVTSADYRVNEKITRSDSSLVYNQIIKDLIESESLLSSTYPTTEKVRVNRFAASAMLARVYLYARNWSLAETKSTEIIGSNVYQLASLTNTFVSNNSEAILQFIPAVTQASNTAEAFNFIPPNITTVPLFILTPTLLSSFETADARKSLWTKSVTINSVTYYYPFKYKLRTGTPGVNKTEYNNVLRLTEQYLIRAEARAELGNLSLSQADLNLIRGRAGLAPSLAATKSQLIASIIKERRVEFFSEWAHRWFDVKRIGLSDSIFGITKLPNWESTDALYPIPLTEMAANPFLTQNPGY